MPKEMNIRVACRCRPLNKLEKSMGGEKCVDILENTISVKVRLVLDNIRSNKRGLRLLVTNLSLMI